VTGSFGRRLRDVVDGIRAEAGVRRVDHAGDAAAAAARRRHLQKAAVAETLAILREAEPVLAGLGLRRVETPEEIRVEAIPGARPGEKFPPWWTVRIRPPAHDAARVVVIEVRWRVDDPRTPLPEDPSTVRFVMADDTPSGLAEVRDFLAVALEDFAASVARYDALPKA
jgi:hypothetical protein